MISGLKPYSKYKDSGIEWLGGVPEHWRIRRLKTCAINVNDVSGGEGQCKVHLALEHIQSWTGRILSQGRGPFDSQARQFAANDVLFGKLRPYLAKVARPESAGICVSEFFVLRPSKEGPLSSEYLEHLLRSKPAIDAIDSTTFGARMPRVGWHSLGGLFLPVPTYEEQTFIVRFLKYMDRRIRRYIGSRQRLISLLNEQKQAIINQVVTRGLNPNVRLKPSGVDWLGDVPEHWTLRRQHHCVQLLVSNVDKRSDSAEVTVRLCNYVDVYKNRRITDTIPFMCATASPEEIDRFRIRLDDVLITKDSESWTDIGVPSLVAYESDDLVCGYHLAILRPRKDVISGDFLFRVSESEPVMRQYHVAANGVTRYGLTRQGVKNIRIPVPPLVEQEAIVQFLDWVDCYVGPLVQRYRAEIALLQEYRTCLVAEVVTGKLDVRDLAELLPEEADKQDESNWIEEGEDDSQIEEMEEVEEIAGDDVDHEG